MTTGVRKATSRSLPDTVLRVVCAAGLLVSAYVHLKLAPGYSLVGDQVTEGTLFRLQAAAAVVAALLLLVRPGLLTRLAAALVAAGSLVALVGTVYVEVPAIGPFPSLYEPAWYPQKAVAAVAAGVALLAAAVSMATRSVRRRGAA